MKKRKNIIYNLLLTVSLIVFLYSGYRLIAYYFEYKNMESVYAEISNQVVNDFEINLNEDLLKQAPKINMDELKNINSEIIGYILIPDTKVSYPIAYSNDELKYLNYDVRNYKSRAGAIFLEPTDYPDFEDTSNIIHGHNMINDTMFGQLNEYVDDEEFFKNHSYFYIYTYDHVYLYRIFCADTIEDGSTTYRLSFSSNASLMRYIQDRIEASEFAPAITPTQTDRIITLSTCSNYGETLRTVVQAYCVDRKPLITE